MMDYKELIERLWKYSQDLVAYKIGAEFSDACNDVADALSKLMEENARLRAELEQVKRERDNQLMVEG